MSAQRAMNPRARAWIAELDLADFRPLADDPERRPPPRGPIGISSGRSE